MENKCYYSIDCEKCGREYDFMEYSPLPSSMICECGAEIVVPLFVGGYGYKNYGVFKGTINRIKTMVKYYATKIFDSIFG